MKRCSSYPSCHRRGLTLIEVIASIGLLSTLLVGALLSHGKLAEQSSRDRKRIAAIELADELLQSCNCCAEHGLGEAWHGIRHAVVNYSNERHQHPISRKKRNPSGSKSAKRSGPCSGAGGAS